MTGSTVVWQETITRGTAIALMHNFSSVADALKELVDNAVDYRWGQPLVIEITEDRRRDRVAVESDGGRGMDARDINVWLNWGEGEVYDSSHIGRWHQGGKAACGFLGRHVRLWAKRKGSDEVWFLEDEDWSTRSEAKNFGVAEPLSRDQYPQTMRDLPTEQGHVRIELTRLVKEKRWNLEVLKRDLSSTYRCLLQTGDVCISINGENVPPLDIPLWNPENQLPINARLPGGRSVSGWAGRMRRDQLTGSVKGGLRLVYNGRLVKPGEWFGYNYEGKGALNSLVGELHMRGFTPVPNKTDFVDRSDEVWEELASNVLGQLAPLIADLRRAGEEARVSKEEKERAREVAEELEKVFASLKEAADLGVSAGSNGSSADAEPAGRKKPEAKAPRPPVQDPRGPNQNAPKARTPPPEDPIGTLARLLEKVTGGSSRPPLRIRSWDSDERSAWTTEGAQVWLDINKSYHLYQHLRGAKAYLAETAILELCGPREGEAMGAAEYIDRVNLMLLKWSHVAGQPDVPDEGTTWDRPPAGPPVFLTRAEGQPPAPAAGGAGRRRVGRGR